MMGMIQTVQPNGIMQAATVSAAMMQDWLKFLDAKPKTTATYTRNIRQFWEYLRERGIHQPTREDVLAYKDYLTTSGKAAATARGYLIAVRLFFQWTADRGIYPNIADHIKAPKVEQYFHKDHLTTRQARRLLSSCDRSTEAGTRDFAILSLMITTGLRTIEVSRANIEDIQTAGDDTVLFIQGKGRDDRAEYVKLSAVIEDAIRDYLTYRDESSGPLFVSVAHRNAGSRMTTRSISRIVKDHLKEVGLNSDRLTAHSLRHTAAHLMIDAGENLRNVQQVLRHANINTTMIYLKQKNRENNNGELKAAWAIFGKGRK
jgi:integrase/recombinase XerD